MLKKSVFLSILILMLCSVAVSALSFTTTTAKIKDRISLDEVAEFDLTISNSLNKAQEYRIIKLAYPEWDIYTKPVLHPLVIKVEANSSKTTRLMVDPMHVLSVGAVEVNIKLKRVDSEEEAIIPFRVAVVSADSLIGGYIPTVITNVDLPKKIDPREKFMININLNNQNPLSYDELIIKLSSNSINKEIEKELEPKEKKDFSLEMQIDPKTKPQEDILVVTVHSGGKIIDGPKSMAFEVLPYSDIAKEISPIGGFLKIKNEITFTNAGNLKYEGPVRIETTPFRSLFTLTRPNGNVITDGGKRYISWEAVLDPDASVSVVVSENYTVLLVIIILLIIIFLAYNLYKSPLIVVKDAANIEKKEGGVASLKVVLTVRNRGGIPLKDIRVADRVPNIANIEKELSIGTLHPTNILRHEKKGSIIKWAIDELGADEERVITYRIKSTLSILGDFNLLPATVRFMFKDRKKTARSNSLSISS